MAAGPIAVKSTDRRIAGYEITFLFGDPRPAAGLDPWLDTFSRSDRAPRRRLTFEFGVGPAEEMPDEAAAVVVEYYYVRGFAHGDSMIYVGADGTRTGVDTAAGRAVTTIPEEVLSGPPWVLRDSVSAALTSFLRADGVFPLHAAALAGGDSGVVIAGPPMAGKTTLSLALLRHGFRWVSDDKVLLAAIEGGIEASGLFDVSNVDPGLARYFPELEGLKGLPAAHPHSPKRAVSVRDLFGTEIAGSCRPGHLLFPRVMDIGPTRVVTLSTTEAFLELLRQSPVVAEAGSARRHVEVLSRLARQTRAFRIETGRDILESPARLSGVLRDMEIPG